MSAPAKLFEWGMTIIGLACFALILVLPLVALVYEEWKALREQRRCDADHPGKA